MNRKHRQTLSSIFHSPVLASIVWSDIEKMIIALGGEVHEASGSRVQIRLNGIRSVFHRPHPQKETDKGAVKDMSRFLLEAGVSTDEI